MAAIYGDQRLCPIKYVISITEARHWILRRRASSRGTVQRSSGNLFLLLRSPFPGSEVRAYGHSGRTLPRDMPPGPPPQNARRREPCLGSCRSPLRSSCGGHAPQGDQAWGSPSVPPSGSPSYPRNFRTGTSHVLPMPVRRRCGAGGAATACARAVWSPTNTTCSVARVRAV